MPSQVYVRNSAQGFYGVQRQALGINDMYQELRVAVNDLTEAVRVDLSEQLQQQQRLSNDAYRSLLWCSGFLASCSPFSASRSRA